MLAMWRSRATKIKLVIQSAIGSGDSLTWVWNGAKQLLVSKERNWFVFDIGVFEALRQSSQPISAQELHFLFELSRNSLADYTKYWKSLVFTKNNLPISQMEIKVPEAGHSRKEWNWIFSSCWNFYSLNEQWKIWWFNELFAKLWFLSMMLWK